MREAGLPGYEISASVASSRPQAHRNHCSRFLVEINTMRSMPDVRKQLEDAGVDAWRFIGQFADVIATETTN